MRIPTCYSSKYGAPTPTASMRKLPVVAREVEARGLAELIDPGQIDLAKLFRLHDPDYVEAFLSGRGRLACSQGWGWSEQIRDGVLAILAGQLLGAKLALERGISANIAQGFHHARYHRGDGYCTFNGLALVAQEYPGLKVGVLDCDQHEGNGTAEFTHRLANLHNITIYGTPFGESTGDRNLKLPLRSCLYDSKPYFEALDRAFAQISAWNIDLLIYQAGADPHRDDPYGTLGLSSEDLRGRDRHVFDFTRQQALPTLFVLAGGYQEPIESTLLPLHVATFEEAVKAFSH